MAEDDNGRHLEAVEDPEETAEEFFPLGSIEGDNVAPQKIIKRGLPVDITVSLRAAEVPVRGEGLLDPNKAGRVLVTFEHARNEDVPVREEGAIVGWKIRQVLRPTYVRHAGDEASLILGEFESLAALDATAAAQLHEQLGRVLSEALQTI